MNTLPSVSVAVSCLVSVLGLAWLAGGCAAPSGESSAPKSGSGITEYRTVAREAHQAVAATVKSQEALAQPRTQTSTPPPALAGFDRALGRLELTSVKARARDEAIIARGQTCFDEWKGSVSGITNQAAARAETGRCNKLHEHFVRVRQRSGEVREEFRPFMAKLREFRARLDQPAGAPSGESSRWELEGVTASGRSVLQTLEAISVALDEAEAELPATLAAK